MQDDRLLAVGGGVRSHRGDVDVGGDGGEEATVDDRALDGDRFAGHGVGVGAAGANSLELQGAVDDQVLEVGAERHERRILGSGRAPVRVDHDHVPLLAAVGNLIDCMRCVYMRATVVLPPGCGEVQGFLDWERVKDLACRVDGEGIDADQLTRRIPLLTPGTDLDDVRVVAPAKDVEGQPASAAGRLARRRVDGTVVEHCQPACAGAADFVGSDIDLDLVVRPGSGEAQAHHRIPVQGRVFNVACGAEVGAIDGDRLRHVVRVREGIGTHREQLRLQILYPAR